MALSLRGVARQHASVMAPFSVRRDLFGRPGATPPSLRGTLAALARVERSFTLSECIYSSTVGYEQTWSHVSVRIRLVPDAGITAATMATLQTTWEQAIESTWSNQRGCARANEARCPFTFDVQFVTSGEHYAVRVRPGPARSNVTTWDTSDTGAVASHEFGHMLGNPDEYADTACPARNPVNTGTVMDNNSPTLADRFFQRLAGDIGSVVA